MLSFIGVKYIFEVRDYVMTGPGHPSKKYQVPYLCKSKLTDRVHVRCCSADDGRVPQDRYGGIYAGRDVCSGLELRTYQEATEICDSYGYQLCKESELEHYGGGASC